MTETESQRSQLIGVNPHSQTLKFLNNKNNIAALSLRKQLASFERQRSMNMSSMEARRLDTELFLKQVKYLEGQDDNNDILLQKEDDKDETTPQPEKPKRHRRKIRLSQTAPANALNTRVEETNSSRNNRKGVKSGPETSAEREHMMGNLRRQESMVSLRMDRKNSMFIQLPGKGKNADSNFGYRDVPNSKTPKPNPRTLLDVMIGLNALKYLPNSTSSEYLNDSFRGDSRLSVDCESIYSDHGNTAQTFMNQWKNKVACRKASLFNKIDKKFGVTQATSTSNLTSVAEDPSRLQRHRKSRMMIRHHMQQRLPVIDDEDERKETFQAWIAEERERANSEQFPLINPNDKQARRRRSFCFWLDRRHKEHLKRTRENKDNIAGVMHLSDLDSDEEEEPQSIGDLMKTLLKMKMSFKTPLDARLKKFNADVEEMVRRDAEARTAPIGKALKRRWKMIMHGVDAALADSSDEEDNYYHTL